MLMAVQGRKQWRINLKFVIVSAMITLNMRGQTGSSLKIERLLARHVSRSVKEIRKWNLLFLQSSPVKLKGHLQ